MRIPTPRTRLVVLLGTPLGHTLSPVMHNRLFERRGLDYLYLPVEVAPRDLATVFTALTRINVAGFNVTIPHKVSVLDLLDEIDPSAELAGAVNTVRVRDGRTRGFNTDGDGFVNHLERACATPIEKRRAFVVGGGGAARGVAVAMAVRGIPRLCLCNRTAGKAQALADDINTRVRACAEAVPRDFTAMEKALAGCDLLVNATSVGMHPRAEALPLDPRLLHPRLTVADLVYKPLETRLLAAAREAGCPTVGGLGMLIHQGALGFRLWTGVEPDIEEMYRAVRPFLD